MDAINRVKYYSSKCVDLMNDYEICTTSLMSDSHGDMEKAIWNAIDEKDLIRLKALHNSLCKMVDEVNK